ncbi:MAG: hypothetical protein Q9162_000154 [Coniocarpon cinnabarinum]
MAGQEQPVSKDEDVTQRGIAIRFHHSDKDIAHWKLKDDDGWGFLVRHRLLWRPENAAYMIRCFDTFWQISYHDNLKDITDVKNINNDFEVLAEWHLNDPQDKSVDLNVRRRASHLSYQY